MRDNNKMNTTIDLKNAIFQALDGCSNKIISRVFQAIRIAVNDEINTLKKTLEIVPRYLKKGGRVAIISFHSIEDRIAKHFLKNNLIMNEKNYYEPKSLGENFKFNLITKKPLIPTDKEVKINSRSRSAKLRVAELL